MWVPRKGDSEVKPIAEEVLTHKERKGSTILWFVIAIIPIVGLYYLWKAAENVSGHEKVIKKHEFLDHLKPKGSTTQWFVIFLIPAILGYAISPLILLGTTGIILMIILSIVALTVGLYMLWRMAEVVSGHEKIFERHEYLDHKEKKDSTIKWLIVGLIPIVNLYFVWKMGEVISAHEKIYE